MGETRIERLIINCPYEEPKQYWGYDTQTRGFVLREGRRPAGYTVATPGSRSFYDPGIFIELPLVNRIRKRVKEWREAEHPYAGVTAVTRKLLEHWRDPEVREYPFFFCQLEAIETLIWLTEAPDAQKMGIEIPGDGGPFSRYCAKMATGTGKTVVMAMAIVWHILNKVTYPQDTRFSKNVLVLAPGLTVRRRLNTLLPSEPGNCYEEFSIVPPDLMDRLRQGKILIRNWHKLDWETDEEISRKKTVDKRGAKSDEAYVRGVLGEMAPARNILVINDEAHHAWRVPAESKVKGLRKEEIERATKWVGGLDRIHRARGILTCYDFSATPFAPSGKKNFQEALFDWIVSDSGLNDAIESGLVKTPRVVIRDDGMYTREYKSRFYHIYNDPEVKDDLNRTAESHEPLPDLVLNAYYFLGKDWLETKRRWEKSGVRTPPVMITVANRTETAARVKYAFDHGKILIDELQSPDKTLHIDSKVLEEAEAQEEPVAEVPESKNGSGNEEVEKPKKLSKAEQAERLRRMVDTVGKPGEPGEQIQNVIAVGMLSEGWDAKTVTHIMGLRAFSSQLLCEQVVGRGLRRTSYEVDSESGMFEPEYVNVFGVPFTFLPHEGAEGALPSAPDPRVRIEPVTEKQQYEITWPNVVRIEHVYREILQLDLEKVEPLYLDAGTIATFAELAPIVDGQPDVTRLSEIDLLALARKFRLQKIVFETAKDVFEQMRPAWKGTKEYLLAQVIRLVERFINSEKILVIPHLFAQDELRHRLVLTLSMNKIVQHIWEAIRSENTETLEPVFDRQAPVRSTSDMRPWYTSKPCYYTKKSHVNFCACDSTWEATEAFRLDHNPLVDAWVKNDHLGFSVPYVYQGVIRKYRPDFLVRLRNRAMLVLEVKGKETDEDKTKWHFLDEWIKAVNHHGGFGFWRWAVSKHPTDVDSILEKAFQTVSDGRTSVTIVTA